jgi:ABC-type transport system involved in Fe-S cluster assembly fused permease/ATPase subunit
MIAHRLSTVLNADKIFYLNDGTIEDSGTFEELKIKNANFGKLAEVAGL